MRGDVIEIICRVPFETRRTEKMFVLSTCRLSSFFPSFNHVTCRLPTGGREKMSFSRVSISRVDRTEYSRLDFFFFSSLDQQSQVS